jgi:hypothetical protein
MAAEWLDGFRQSNITWSTATNGASIYHNASLLTPMPYAEFSAQARWGAMYFATNTVRLKNSQWHSPFIKYDTLLLERDNDVQDGWVQLHAPPVRDERHVGQYTGHRLSPDFRVRVALSVVQDSVNAAALPLARSLCLLLQITSVR